MLELVMVVGLFFTLCLLPLLTTLGGALVGWFVSLTPMAAWVTSGLQLLTGVVVAGDQLYKIGAALGFVGGFFRSSNTNSNRGSGK